MPAPESASNSVTGLVVSTNPKGLKLDGHDAWFNFSKFSTDIVPPERGQTVTLSLDRAGFVRAVEASGSATSDPTSSRQTSSQRETVITRLACVKASAEFCASRPDLRSSDLIALAQRLEEWVNRPYEGRELVDLA